MRDFGYSRVVEPKGFIPVTAWKLDNTRKLQPGEIRISIKRIKFEDGSFRQLCNECAYDENKIKLRVMDIVKKRGKQPYPQL